MIYKVRSAAIAVGLLFGIGLASASPAGAIDMEEAIFKVEIDAAQHSDWTLDWTTYDGCVQGDVRQFGSGAQSFSLTTKKPVKVTASYVKSGKFEDITFYAGKPTNPRDVPVNVAADRDGTITTQQLSGSGGGCGDGDGTSQPPPKDCGPRSFQANVELDHVFPESYPDVPVPLVPVLLLGGPFDDEGSYVLGEQWTNCPGGATDHLLVSPLGTLQPKKVIGKDDKFAVKVKDTEVYDSEQGFHETTRVNWKVQFRRVG